MANSVNASFYEGGDYMDSAEVSSNNPPHSLTISSPENHTLKVKFNGWRNPMQKWNSWVDRLCSTHGSTWKDAGIFEPIMASRYNIEKDEELIFGLAKKWCPETNTFILKWGEATVSLEDMLILGGYSVIGESVFTPIETEDMLRVEEKLNNVKRVLHKTKSKKASHHLWIKYFIDVRTDFEHEAFLSLWLSRYVFPSIFDTILKHLFPLAIHLARGTRIALAPAVLATIYRDLGLLKAAIDACTVSKLVLWGQFQFVQAWIWERFVALRTGLNYIEQDMPRLARWHGKYWPRNDVFDLDSSGVCFQWRPYTKTLRNWSFPKFYAERETRVIVSPDMDTEFVSYVRCIRACKIVGIECTEQYLPHRVAMQFGMEQDIPAHISKFHESLESAWNNYVRPITEDELYIPSRLFNSGVTSRYEEWWKIAHQTQFTPMTANHTSLSEGCLSTPPEFSHKQGLSDVQIRYKGVEIHIDMSSDEEDRR